MNFPTRFIETADQVNAHMPEYTVERIAELLNDDGKSVRGSKILVIGIAYKPDVSDDRESASVDVAVRLLEKGADVAVIDPHVREDRIARHGFTIATAEDDFDKYQIAAVLTDHTDIPYETIARSVPRVFDARGVYRRLGIDADNVETL